MKHLHTYFFSLVAILVISCAQQVAPTGGPEDEKGPRIKESTPENYSVNFTGDRIDIEFDEFVQQSNLFTEMIITPLFEEQPDVKFKGKKVTVQFNEELKDSTTYNINFGKGIVDFTEQNPMDTPTFIFSTGPFLDSVFLSGTVKEAETLKPVEGVLVMLYDRFADSIPKTEKPVYFARSNKKGEYNINYLKGRKYQVFALIDGNSNYLFDLPEETIGFSDTIIDLNQSDTIDFYTFNEDVQKQYVVKAEAAQFGKLSIILNKPAADPIIRTINRSYKEQWYIEDINKTKDTLVYWLTAAEEKDTLEIEIADGTTILDTSSIVIPSRVSAKTQGRGAKKTTEFKLKSTNNLAGGKLGVNDDLQITFSHPLQGFEIDSLLLLEGKDTIPINIEFLSDTKRKVKITHKWNNDSTYTFTAVDSAFTDIFGLQSDSIGIEFTKRKAEDYGTLTVIVDSSEKAGPYILQLMVGEKLLQEQVVNIKDTAAFPFLLPQSYVLKLIYDANADSKWTTGNYDEKRQPEQVIYYAGKIDVKANWENEIIWKIGEVKTREKQ